MREVMSKLGVYIKSSLSCGSAHIFQPSYKSYNPSTSRPTNRVRHLRNSYKPYKPTTNRPTNRARCLRNTYNPYKPYTTGGIFSNPNRNGLYGLYTFLRCRARFVWVVVSPDLKNIFRNRKFHEDRNFRRGRVNLKVSRSMRSDRESGG